ncbi:MAG: tannase/feruloyl esterase family alpha/beta hydrolase [Candidatus Andeanibacterium colombiense]|uniref:Tannase/feruloyl esterase family alpha/beta hydrolase n=1 Tax=Candidatus Andeanibacterium colombiense TaxID=3121345 RepID=A0AAJ6BNV3_9SPHN|nr:MAG: tannase/feruloyl esterase family alpha/beta hydrolase [Sphingomonadaceae bacterium]
MLKAIGISGALVIGAGLLSSCGTAHADVAQVGNGKCDAATATSLGGSNPTAKWVAGEGEVPAYCEIGATLSPEAGSTIGVVFRLPEGWNGKILGLGGGGWAGNVTLEAAKPGLIAHYATAQTDGGHASAAPFENAWVVEDPKARDFSWRAVHEMTAASKTLVAAYYGRGQEKAYFQGCSTGGRMALMEAQRFPADYDAIIAGAPVYELVTQTSAVFRNNSFAAPGAAIGIDGAKKIAAAALAQCDAKDGVKDGVIADPRSCNFDPASVPGLTPGQVAAVRTAYSGVRAPDGSWAQWPMSRGGEADWHMFVAVGGDWKEFSNGGGFGGLLPVLFPGSIVDMHALTPAQVVEARQSAFAKMYEAKDTNLTPFFQRGGKLLMWHGESDPGPSPVGTIDYVEGVKQADPAGAAKGLRLFLAPGVNHCGGGAGADQLPLLEQLDSWLTSGKAPETIVAKKADGSMVRPLCAWPKVAQFGGKGDANDPKNYRCIDRTS